MRGEQTTLLDDKPPDGRLVNDALVYLHVHLAPDPTRRLGELVPELAEGEVVLERGSGGGELALSGLTV